MEPNDAGLAWEILQRYDDPATPRFDAALDAALDAAALPEELARTLRFWQRESVANVRHFAAEALPAVLAAIDAARRDTADATHRAAAAREAYQVPRTPGVSPWAVPREAEAPAVPEFVITLPDAAAEPPENTASLEERRRTVAARLADLG